MAQAEAERFELRGFLETFRRRRVTLALITLGVIACAGVFSALQTRIYQASAEVLILPRDTESVFSSNNSQQNTATPTVETEVRVLRSDPVRRAVRASLGSIPPVTAGRIGETEVMKVNATSTRPRRAAQVANAYARAYVDFRKSQAVGDLASASRSIQDKIKALQAQIDALDKQLTSSPSSQLAGVQASIGPRYDSLIAEQGLLAQKLDSLQVDANLKSGGAQLVRQAAVPGSPSAPKPIRNLLIGLVVGLIVGTGVIFLQEHLDDSVKTKPDLVDALPGVPVLGVVPVIEDWDTEHAASQLDAMRASTTPAAEAYRSLRTSVQLLGVERPLRTLQVTSAVAGEGKTTLIANLAVVLAMPGQRVVMVDCDLRRPRLHELFGRSNELGFTSVFQGGSALDALQRVSVDDSLYLLPSGPLPPNPSELLASNRTAELLFELQGAFDVVLVDSAPVLPVTDAIVLAAWVEATILVARAGKTTARILAESLERLRSVDARVAGTVLNDASPEAVYGYGGGYAYADSTAH
ncbi:MAG: capsular biosynthesis protein [Acidimicrobiales bacterium]|nr:capsular biosynthesis protein [Acidimicrobiales bacterium]